jgi:hypothetical protein
MATDINACQIDSLYVAQFSSEERPQIKRKYGQTKRKILLKGTL